MPSCGIMMRAITPLPGRWNMRSAYRLFALCMVVLVPTLLCAQASAPKILDAHVHHNGDPAFLEKLGAKLDSVDGLALLITAPVDIESVKAFIAKHPNRLMG